LFAPLTSIFILPSSIVPFPLTLECHTSQRPFPCHFRISFAVCMELPDSVCVLDSMRDSTTVFLFSLFCAATLLCSELCFLLSLSRNAYFVGVSFLVPFLSRLLFQFFFVRNSSQILIFHYASMRIVCRLRFILFQCFPSSRFGQRLVFSRFHPVAAGGISLSGL